ncbi:peptide/nickel transport system ATP-binding protein [Roseovarius azorensis]|uniref:Peptide/nickel transport system ATP-binding protein n=1 Tax=Roseovarius azorensis TaxID=1287727 RepID=A0A1H7Y0I8_9RHOB|nr:ABC transporter ATP-binding protein [Roseovarius azorensis]SEM39706.1 peptide/nickel transport system ATP-binding protein [Roseovarius azorensis]
MSKVLDVRSLRMETESGVPIIDDVSFSVASGEVVALIGESGAGKSTIGLSALGYKRPGLRFSGGQVLLNGQDMLSANPAELRARRGREVAYVAQSAAAAFNAVHRLGSQITEAPQQHGIMSRTEAEEQLVRLARQMQLPDPENIARRYPHEVSGGQLQRLMVIMAMACRPDLLVFDEPTTALDVTTQVEVLAALKETLRDSGASAVYVSHDLAVVAQIADRIVVLRNGRMVETGTTAQIIEAPQQTYTRELLGAVNTVPKLKAVPREHTARPPAPIVELKGIQAAYPKYGKADAAPVLHDINISIPKGRVLGVIGESGSGKSTLAKVISGLLPQTGGEVLLDGQVLSKRIRSRSLAQRRDLQLVVQMPDLAFNPARSIASSLDRQLAFFTDLSAKARKDRIADLMRMVELDPEITQRMPHQLSGGQKQRVSLARALSTEPALLLCDEVTSALDTVVAASIVDLLKKFKHDIGQSMMFISHDIATVAKLADYVAVLKAGCVVELKPLRDLLSKPEHPYTQMLLNAVPDLRPGWLESHRGDAGVRSAEHNFSERNRTGAA